MFRTAMTFAVLYFVLMGSSTAFADKTISLALALDGCVILGEIVDKGKLDDGTPLAAFECEKFAPQILSQIRALNVATIKRDKQGDIYKFGSPNVELARCIDFPDGRPKCTFYILGKTAQELRPLKDKHIDEEFDVVDMFGLHDTIRKQIRSDADNSGKEKETDDAATLQKMFDDCIIDSLAVEAEPIIADSSGKKLVTEFPVLTCTSNKPSLLDALERLELGKSVAYKSSNSPAAFYMFGAPEPHYAQCSRRAEGAICNFLFPKMDRAAVEKQRQKVLVVDMNSQDLLPLNDAVKRVLGPGEDHSDNWQED